MSEIILFRGLEAVVKEVLLAFAPLLALFFVFQALFLRLPRETVLNVVKGTVLAFVGLVLFLHGVHVGFLPAGSEVGLTLGGLPYRWVLIPVGLVLGFLAAIAELAVRVLAREVERASTGYLRERLILLTVAGGVGLFVAPGMASVLYGIPLLYILIPGYALALVLLGFSRPSFVSIAFDSGGVATGPMTVTFILAVAVGAATAMRGRNPIVDGFGLIALVALAPILSVMILGLLFGRREAGM